MRAAAEIQLPTFSDATGLLASVACAIHCAAMPFVAGYLPVLGLTWLADSAFHRVMAFVCFAFAVLAFLPGWRKHRSLIPAAIGAAGVGLLSVAAFGLEEACCPTCAAVTAEPASDPACTDADCQLCAAEATEPAASPAGPSPLTAWAIPLITPFGGVLLIAGHLTNHRKLCSCEECQCGQDNSCGQDLEPIDLVR